MPGMPYLAVAVEAGSGGEILYAAAHGTSAEAEAAIVGIARALEECGPAALRFGL